MPILKIEIKNCIRKEPPHPCDPPGPCDICDEGDGECPEPSLCLERLNHPQKPHETRCKAPAAYMGVMPCKRKEPPHPCDPPPACEPGKPPKNKCPDFALCRHRIKNPEPNFVICPDDDIMKYSFELCKGMDVMKTPLPECKRGPCDPPPQLDPFMNEVEPEPEPPPKRSKLDYPKTLCDNLEDLKKKVEETYNHRCSPPIQIDPFKFEEEMQKIRNFPEEEDPCADAKTKKR